MSNLHRIQWIDTQIRENRFPNCSRIAEEFCISKRQASRDIEYLRDSLSAPIEYSPTRYGYYYSDNTFVLPGVMVTETEKQALTYLANQYREASSSLASSLADLFSRLTGEQSGQTPDHFDLPRISVHEKEIKQYNILQQAIRDLYKVDMKYVNAGNRKSRRLFCPYKIFRKNSLHYIVGYCELKNEIRIFRLSRIREISITRKPFRIIPGFDESQYGEDFDFDFKDPYKAIVAFEGPISSKALDMDSVSLGNGTYQITFLSSSQLMSSLMRLDVNFEILHPAWLKTRMVNRMEEIIKKNLP